MTRRDGLVCLALVAATLAVYAGVLASDFVRFDDPRYVTQNPNVRGGLNADGVAWAFTTLYKSNWQPLSWLSHMLDVELFGLDPGGHHATSLLLHALNALALFALLRYATGDPAPSALAAALFALHPTHVESVAWIAERKDVLATLFGLLAGVAYVAYARRGGGVRYGLTALFLTLSLMSKPMLVTLPFALLLLDYWPLGRLRTVRSAAGLAVEKLPLVAIAVGVAIVTLIAQREGGAVGLGAGVSLPDRFANALVSYVRYVGKTLWPSDLSILYPHPQMQGGTPWHAWQIALAGAALALATAGSLWDRGRPYLAFGWLWFLGTLVPVIGLVQVGFQAMADRYTYVPGIGLYVILAWGGADLQRRLSGRRPRMARALMLAAVLWLGALALVTQRQVGFWRDSVTLFEHSLAAAPGAFVLHRNLGNALQEQGRLDEAIDQYRQAIAVAPDYILARRSLIAALLRRGEVGEAVAQLRALLERSPDSIADRTLLAHALRMQGSLDESIAQYRVVVEARPDEEAAHRNLGEALMTRDVEGAIAAYRRALELEPDSAAARAGLARALRAREEAGGHSR